MLNVTGKFVSVFKVEDKGKYSASNLTTSKKKKDNTYENMYWRARYVGEAYPKSLSLKNKDKIEITQAVIENNYDKDNKTLWVTVVIFDFNVQQVAVNEETK